MDSDDEVRHGPLVGVKVVDLTQAIAGPYAAMLLADLGADVIKIEPPWGDTVRSSPPHFSEDEPYGAYFQSVNRSKRSLCVDLTTEEGQETVYDIVEESDVVLENFRSQEVTKKLGVSYEDMKRVKEDIVYASISGFGHEDVLESRYSGRKTVDMVSQAMGGIMSVTGSEESGPTKVGPGIGDIFPGTLTVVGLLAALWHKERTGEGQIVDVAMVDAILSLTDTRMIEYSYNGKNPELSGNSHPHNFPYDVFDTSDGSVVIAAITDKMWTDLCQVIGKPHLSDEYPTEEDRKSNEDLLYDEINEWTQSHSKEEVMGELYEFLPVGPLYNAEGIFNDPHFEDREMLVDVPHGDSGEKRTIAGQPIKFSRTLSGIQHRAPILGEHSREILEEMGYDDEDIERLLSSGAIQST